MKRGIEVTISGLTIGFEDVYDFIRVIVANSKFSGKRHRRHYVMSAKHYVMSAEHRRAISEGRRRLVEAIDKNAKKVIKAKEAMENALNSKKV